MDPNRIHTSDFRVFGMARASIASTCVGNYYHFDRNPDSESDPGLDLTVTDPAQVPGLMIYFRCWIPIQF